ncbi:MAG: hypothetical protein JO026_02340 [Patescibacteria group bacterium]|nr:hypothetical protein [Patescibacteria group bacterium]
MEPPEKYSWIDEFLAAAEEALGFMDISTLQPTSWRHFQPLVAKEWLAWLERIVTEREKQNIPFTTVAAALDLDLCREQLLFTLEDLKTAHYPVAKRLAIADFFYQTLVVQTPQGDPSGLHGTTRKHSREEVTELMQKDFAAGNPEAARALGKLYNGAYNLGAALYLDFYMAKAIENWGPYEITQGRILVVKRMKNLLPTAVWDKIDTPIQDATIYAVYEGVKFSTDLVSCHTRYIGDAIRGLVKWRLEVDGENVTDLATIEALALSIAETGIAQWNRVKKLSESELIQKAIWIRCYCFDRVCQLLGLAWHPSEELLGASSGKTLAEGWKRWRHPFEPSSYHAYWRSLWDPRLDFFPDSEPP